MSSLLKDKKEKNTFAQNAQSPVFKENTSLSQSPLSQKLSKVTQDFEEGVRALPVHYDHAHTLKNQTYSEQDTNNFANEEEKAYFTSPQVHNETLNRQNVESHSSAKHLPFNLDKRAMQNTLAQHASTQVFLQSNLQRHEAKSVLANVPAYSKKSSIAVYKKQLVETRTLIYYQQHLRMLSDKEKKDPEAKRRFVIKRVARELWTNFCVRGQETPMLHFLHEALRKAYNEDLKFYYKPGSIELMIMRPINQENATKTDSQKLNASQQQATPKKVTKENALKIAMASQEAIKEELAKQKVATQKNVSYENASKELSTQSALQKNTDTHETTAINQSTLNIAQQVEQDKEQGKIHATGQNFDLHTDFDLQEYEAVNRQLQVEMVNKAWQLSQEIVASYATE